MKKLYVIEHTNHINSAKKLSLNYASNFQVLWAKLMNEAPQALIIQADSPYLFQDQPSRSQPVVDLVKYCITHDIYCSVKYNRESYNFEPLTDRSTNTNISYKDTKGYYKTKKAQKPLSNQAWDVVNQEVYVLSQILGWNDWASQQLNTLEQIADSCSSEHDLPTPFKSFEELEDYCQYHSIAYGYDMPSKPHTIKTKTHTSHINSKQTYDTDQLNAFDERFIAQQSLRTSQELYHKELLALYTTLSFLSISGEPWNEDVIPCPDCGYPMSLRPSLIQYDTVTNRVNYREVYTTISTNCRRCGRETE